jgi:hypothetical protein
MQGVLIGNGFCKRRNMQEMKRNEKKIKEMKRHEKK